MSEPDRAGRNGFQAALPVPDIPGVYRLRLGLAEVDRKTPSRMFKPITVQVLEPYTGAITLPKAAEVTAGSALSVKLGRREHRHDRLATGTARRRRPDRRSRHRSRPSSC